MEKAAVRVWKRKREWVGGDGNGDGAGAPPPPAPKPMFEGANNNFIVSSGFAGTGISDAIVTENSGVETAASGSDIGGII